MRYESIKSIAHMFVFFLKYLTSMSCFAIKIQWLHVVHRFLKHQLTVINYSADRLLDNAQFISQYMYS